MFIEMEKGGRIKVLDSYVATVVDLVFFQISWGTYLLFCQLVIDMIFVNVLGFCLIKKSLRFTEESLDRFKQRCSAPQIRKMLVYT